MEVAENPEESRHILNYKIMINKIFTLLFVALFGIGTQGFAQTEELIIGFDGSDGLQYLTNEQLRFIYFTTPDAKGYDVSEIGVHVNNLSDAGTLKMAIYDDNEALVFETDELTVTGGVDEYVFELVPSGTLTLEDLTSYRIAVMGSSPLKIDAHSDPVHNGTATFISTASYAIYTTVSYPTFPDPLFIDGASYRVISVVLKAYTEPTSYTISTSSTPADGGTTSGGGTFTQGQSVSLTATPATGYDFVNWTEDGTEVSTSATYSFSVTEDRTLVANFELQTFNISASVLPANSGTITGDGTYDYNTTCELVATPETGYDFVNWTVDGTEVSTDATYSFTVTENRTLVANFELQTFEISASVLPANSGTITGAGTYDYNTTCELVATPEIGYDFVNWTEDGTEVSTDATYSFTVTENRTLVANFELQTFNISASVLPANSGTITGDGTYDYNTTCELVATPETGYDFVNWTVDGTEVSTDATYSFTVTENRTLVANFELQTFEISASVLPANSGTITGAGTYDYNTTCELVATPETGYDFVNWTEDGTQVSTNATYTFTATSNRTLVAEFTTTASISDLSETGAIIVYPNPNNGQFTIEFDNNYIGDLNIKIYSVTGSVIKELKINKALGKYSYDIDLGNIAVGTYYIGLSTSKGKVTKTIIIH